MTYYSLFIKARSCPEVVERILRIIRHRGFELFSLNMISCNELHNKQITLSLTVFSNRSIYLLYTQLDKLIDVDYVEIR